MEEVNVIFEPDLIKFGAPSGQELESFHKAEVLPVAVAVKSKN
jgi:hypothetical protein